MSKVAFTRLSTLSTVRPKSVVKWWMRGNSVHASNLNYIYCIFIRQITYNVFKWEINNAFCDNSIKSKVI